VLREILWDFERKAHYGEVGGLCQEVDPLQPFCIRHPASWVVAVFHEITSCLFPFSQEIFLLGGCKANRVLGL
jgi:hypothetical protein